MRKRLLALVSVLLFLSLISIGESFWGPRVYMHEQVTGHYNTSGLYAASGTPEYFDARGWMGVMTPNTNDILQYVRVNISEFAPNRTNIRLKDNYTLAFRDYAISYPSLEDSTLMYFNTTTSPATLYYTPDYSWAPPLNMSVIITNDRGGRNLYSSNNLETPVNLMHFNFTIRNDGESGKTGYTENNITLILLFKKDSYILASASIDQSTLETNNGAVFANDSGNNPDLDTIIWSGKLDAGDSATITFDANITSLRNYLGKNDNLNGESTFIGARATYETNTTLFTGINMTGSFARGPVREGLDLSRGFSWNAKIYIKNMANSSVAIGEHNLTYNLTSWGIYNITGINGSIESLITSNDSLDLLLYPGQTYLTPQWTPTTRSKPYIAPYFDWYVIFNSTGTYSYSSALNITLQLPTLHELDVVSEKLPSSRLLSYVIDGKIMSVNISAIHSGSTSSDARTGRIHMYSTIPFTDSESNGFANMSINESTLRLFYRNTTSIVRLDLNDTPVTYTIIPTTNTSNGSIECSISDLSRINIFNSSADFGRNLTTLDRIILSFDLYGHPNETGVEYSGLDNGELYVFDGNLSFWTISGTPLTVDSHMTKIATDNILEAYKELTNPDSSHPEIVEVKIRLDITGSVENIKFRDYLPYGATNMTSLAMVYGGTPWYEGIHFNRTYLGTTLTSDGANVTVWEYTNVSPSSDGWDIIDNWISLTYRMNISMAGAYILPLQIVAFDPGAERGIALSRYGTIMVESRYDLKPMIIREDFSLYPAKSFIVDEMPVYRKSFTVYNPNDHSSKSSFYTDILSDTLQVSLSYYTPYGKKVIESPTRIDDGGISKISWESVIGPYESRTYEIRLSAPPVMLLSRNTQILEKTENKNVLLETEMILKNNAYSEYPSVRLPLDMSSDKIVSIMDSDGNYLDYITDDIGSVFIELRNFAGNTLKTITVRHKESYPSLFMTADNPRYDSGSTVSFSMNIINGMEKIYDPCFEAEIYTENNELIYADIIAVPTMDVLEEKRVSFDWVIPDGAPTGRYVAYLKFKEDMSEITSASTGFYVLGSNSGDYAWFVIFCVFGIILRSIYIHASKYRDGGIS